jgi:spermidine dehydrogenase
MSKQITRRDFCNGIAIGTGMNFMGPMNLFGQIEFASQDLEQSYYLPILTGMRGSHKGSFEVASAWRAVKEQTS